MVRRHQPFALAIERGHGLNLDQRALAIETDPGLGRRRSRIGEMRETNPVNLRHERGNCLVVVLAVEVNVVLDDVGHTGASLRQHTRQCIERVRGLSRDVVADHAPVLVERHLAADEDEITRFDGLRPARRGAAAMAAGRNSLRLHASASLDMAPGIHLCRLTPRVPPPGSARTTCRASHRSWPRWRRSFPRHSSSARETR